MKKWLGIMLSICLITILMGCGSTESKQTPDSTESSKEQESETAAEDTVENNEKTTEQTDAPTDHNSAVIFFTGTGNTKVIAQSIAEELSSPIYEIEPVEKYTDADLNYSDDNCRANKEQNDDSARPEIANDLSEVTEYETIYLGYPIWWGTNPKIIQTFLDSYDLSGKTVYTFCTSGSSGIETSVANLQKLYPDVNIVSGNRFEVNVGKDVIASWIEGLN